MVSVLLLSWNHEKYIEQSIRSILDQTYKDIEIIFLDNNSSDKTFSIALSLLERSGVEYQAFKNEKSYGIPYNQNFLLSKSAGEYVCLMSGDDWLHRSNIEEKLKVFEQHSSAGMVYSNGYKYYDEIGVYELIEPAVVSREDFLHELLKKNFISGLGCLIKREVLENVGGWDPLVLIDDGDLWVKIVLKYEIIGIDKPLFFYRQHVDGISKDPEFMYKGKMEWFQKYRHLNRNQEISLRNITENYLSNKVMSDTSFSTFWKVLKNFRFNKFYCKLLLKSLLPVSWKQFYFIRSLKKKNQHTTPPVSDSGVPPPDL